MTTAGEILIKTRELLQKRTFATKKALEESYNLLGWLIGPPYSTVAAPPIVDVDISVSTAELVCGLVEVQLPADDSLLIIKVRITIYRARMTPAATTLA